jgi:ubiquinone/menaquinone biosynthesis C-methylase UbiE
MNRALIATEFEGCIRMTSVQRRDWLVFVLGMTTLAAAGQDGPPEPKAKPVSAPGAKAPTQETSKSKSRPRARPGHRHEPGSYHGRAIAEVMSYLGADWLVRPERIEEEQPELMLQALRIQPGWTVADVGAGVGYHSFLIAKLVGPSGRVLATDVQPEMLRMLRNNARQLAVKNVEPVLCTQLDPKLPEGKVDLALMVDVYHEMSHPEVSVRGIRNALRPQGRLVLVEFRGEDPDVPIKPEHKMTVEQVKKEIEPLGFVLKETHEFLPWQHILVFEKTADTPPEKNAGVAPASGPDGGEAPRPTEGPH